MKFSFRSLVCVLALATSAQSFARASADGSAPDAALSKLDAAELYVRLNWAKLYLADLEMNDSVMGRLGVPARVSPGRTVYAVGKTALNGSLIAAAYTLVRKSLKTNAVGRAVNSSALVQVRRRDIAANKANIATIRGKAKLGLMPLGSASEADTIAAYRNSIAVDRRTIATALNDAKYAPIHRAVRGVGITFGIGVVATLVYDGVRTWMQVRHDGEAVAEQKQNLRDFIAYAERRLARADAR